MRLLPTTLALLLATGGLTACGEPDNDGDGSPYSLDCDDANPAMLPGAVEICDGLDNNCDGFIDEPNNVIDAPTWYLDRDVDGFGDDTVTETRCTPQGGGWASVGGDCDDEDPAAAPGQQEICNGKDDDCDGDEDEPEEATGTQLWFEDYDFDSYGDPESGLMLCPQQVPRLWVRNGDDCNDSDASQYPGAAEYCNEEDDDCDTEIDELNEVVDGFDSWRDQDSDGYGDPATTLFVCALPTGYVDRAGDCNDGDAVVALGCGCTTAQDNDLVVPAGRTVTIDTEGGELHYGDVTVEAGATLRITGLETAYLFATKVTVAGTIDVAARKDVAGPGGGKGGGSANCYAVGGKGGGSFASSKGGGGGGQYPYSSGGGGGGHADPGSDGVNGVYYAVGGTKGDAFGDVSLDPDFGGGGGGGGGGSYGGVGGGGGGGLKIVAGEINVSGVIDARGADGATAGSAGCYYGGGGGGGGAGGAVWLHGDRVIFSGTMMLAAGKAGTGRTGSYYYYEGTTGGAGSVGRARVSGSQVTLTGEADDRIYSDRQDPSCDSPFVAEEE